jgi:hypothetical protein
MVVWFVTLFDRTTKIRQEKGRRKEEKKKKKKKTISTVSAVFFGFYMIVFLRVDTLYF